MRLVNAVRYVRCLVLVGITVALFSLIYLYSGIYPIAADSPHNPLTLWLLETLREQSVSRYAADVNVPDDLNSEARRLQGGVDYRAMCQGCHLYPGAPDSEIRQGLYPTPPNLSQDHHDHHQGDDTRVHDSLVHSRERFWVIKHGIKASGMPAWGKTHSDEKIWNLVAFLQHLPSLSADEYRTMTERNEGQNHHH